MPQVFQVLRCYQCEVFQVHQAKKSNKFECKLCGEKQSIKRNYGIGTAKDCRLQVQKLNGIRGEQDEVKKSNDTDTDDDIENVEIKKQPHLQKPNTTKSKWSDYIDKTQTIEGPSNEDMYLGNTKVVLELPKKQRKTFKCPTLKTSVENIQCDDVALNKITNMKVPVPKNNIDSKSKALDSVINTCTGVKEAYEMDLQKPKNPVIPQFVPPTSINTVNCTSKWAQFVTEHNVETDEDNETNGIPATLKDEHCISPKSSQEKLFSLCDDNDLDQILDI